jgi:hypothetical protein
MKNVKNNLNQPQTNTATLTTIIVRAIVVITHDMGGFLMDSCEKCEGKLWYVVPNYQHDILERIECFDCLAHMRFKDHLVEELSKVIVSASPQRLALLLSEFIVQGADKNAVDDLGRIENIIHTKNINEAFLIGGFYSKE